VWRGWLEGPAPDFAVELGEVPLGEVEVVATAAIAAGFRVVAATEATEARPDLLELEVSFLSFGVELRHGSLLAKF
jgi:hypothetical protein